MKDTIIFTGKKGGNVFFLYVYGRLNVEDGRGCVFQGKCMNHVKVSSATVG